MNIRLKSAGAAVLAAGLSLGSARAQQITINGAGATFPYPIYSKWFDEYHKAHAGVQINYQSIGSGGGIRQVTEGTVDFGATDGPMSDEQIGKVKGKILHIPTVLGAVVPTFNVEGVSELNLSGAVLADIFLGKITKWNDPAIAKLNKDAKLPDAPITVVHRSDGSGTTFVFVDYLSKVSKEWETKVGRATSVNWPAGLGGKGNEGVAGLVKQTPNALGYNELIYAVQNDIKYASVQNKSGNFVKADLASVSAAAAGVKMPKDYRVSITDGAGAKAYPISSFTWLLVYEQNAAPKGRILKDFLGWMLDGGQKMASDLHYAPLPDGVKASIKKTIAAIGDRAGS
ncbi:MAG: phosphate ABC transporter substrate-binding protein PstS [Proteobacteria bacterium]|nr:phosphate ABC transporter substrate-binding protein PstS [Pseudomonadota bacterium]